MIQTQPHARVDAPRPVLGANLGKSVIESLADAMREGHNSGQTVDRHLLTLKGFTREQIDENWEAARDMANQWEFEAGLA